MDKKELFDKTKRYITRALKVRRAIKTFLAFSIGISTGIVTYQELYVHTGCKPISICYAILVGAATIALALIVRFIIDKCKKIGLWLFHKIKRYNNERQK